MFETIKDPAIRKYLTERAQRQEGVGEAQGTADVVSYADVAGKLLNKAAQAQQPTAIYRNRMQDLGSTPRTEQRQVDYSDFGAGDLAQAGIQRAQEGVADVDRDFQRQTQLSQLDASRYQEQQMNDPNSEASKQARALLKQIAPNAAQLPGFDTLTAARAEKISEPLGRQARDVANRTFQRNMAREARDFKAEQARLDREDKAQVRQAKQAAQQAAQKEKAKQPPKLTETQGKAAGFAIRMATADQDLSNLESQGYDRAAISSGIGSLFPNVSREDEAVAYEQAESNFINALLRRESGAAISDTEKENYAEQYFPRVGDGPKTLEQKRINRQQAIESMEKEAGPGLDGVTEKPSWAK